MHVYEIRLRNAAGREMHVQLAGRTESAATSAAVRRVEAETGQRWYAVTALWLRRIGS